MKLVVTFSTVARALQFLRVSLGFPVHPFLEKSNDTLAREIVEAYYIKKEREICLCDTSVVLRGGEFSFLESFFWLSRSCHSYRVHLDEHVKRCACSWLLRLYMSLLF